MDGTIIQQGRFRGTGANVIIPIRSDVDWMSVYNETVLTAAGAGTGAQFYWQRGMTQGTGIIYNKTAVTNAISIGALVAPNGFYLLDTSVVTATRSLNPITNISNGLAIPRVTSIAHGLLTGDIVTIANAAGALQLGSILFRVTRFNADNFDLSWMSPIAVAAAPGPDAYVWKVSNEQIYIPRNRVITSITQAAQAVVTMSAPHQFTVGQRVRFHIPRVTNVAFGMIQLDGVQANVVSIDLVNNTITIDVDTTGMTAFEFPESADIAFTPAQVTPVGEDTATALNLNADILGDRVRNVAILGMSLPTGTGSPGGILNDVIYWVAGKSFSVNNL